MSIKYLSNSAAVSQVSMLLLIACSQLVLLQTQLSTANWMPVNQIFKEVPKQFNSSKPHGTIEERWN